MFDKVEPVLTNLNYFGQVQSILNKFEPVWLTFHPFWTSLKLFEKVCISLDQFEPIWTSLNWFENLFGQVESNLEMFEPIWAFLIHFGQVWTNLDKFEGLWTCLISIVILWKDSKGHNFQTWVLRHVGGGEKPALRACQTSPEAKNILPKGSLNTPFKAGQNL